MSSSSSPHRIHQRDDFSLEQERHMHYILDEGISELKKSSDTNKSAISHNTSSERSFTLRNQLKIDKESRSNSREYKRKQIYDKYHQQHMMNNIPQNNSSSLRMFLEELKNENNHDNSQRKGKDQHFQSHREFSPSSMASSANIDILRMQEESFSKIHHDIASLQNKIKGLESKLGPSNSSQSYIQNGRSAKQNSSQKILQEKADQYNRRKQQLSENENRIKTYQVKHSSHNKNTLIQEYNQGIRYIDGNYKTQNDIQDRHQIQKHNELQESSEDTDSDTQTYQSFPLRLKKQYLQQQIDIENQRVQLNERFNTNQPNQRQPQHQIITERYEEINDSVDKRIQKHSSMKQLEYENQIRSLTEIDKESERQMSESAHSSIMNDSTISISEQMKRKIKDKIKKYKKDQRRRSQSKQSSKRSFNSSMQRSNTQDFSKNDTIAKVKRHVRFSEAKRSSRSRDRKSSQHSNFELPQEVLELRKQNAYLQMQLDKAQKFNHNQEDYYNKWKDLKHQYRELQSQFKKQELKRKEQKEVIDEQKKLIIKLKKKVKVQKEKLKKMQESSPTKSEYARNNLKVNKSYKQFKIEDKENRQKSQRKIVSSDIGNIRNKNTTQQKKNQQDSKNSGNNKASLLTRIITRIKEFFLKFKWQLFYGSAMGFALYLLLKKGIYDKFAPISEVMDRVKASEFKKVVVGGIFLLCYFKSPGESMRYCFANRALLTDETIYEALNKSNTTYSSPIISETNLAIIMGYGLVALFFWKMMKDISDIHGFKGKQKKDIKSEQRVTTFSDVGGCTKAKDAILEIIDYIKNPDLYKSAGVRMPRGVLLYGPPGTGKTLIAKAAATEAGIPVIYASGSEFVEVFVGLGAKRVRDVFKQARAQAPCMIFIDEIDAVGFSRGNNNYIMGGGHREMETTLNELLNQMDGFEENDRIVVVAATNLATTLDPALQRPGRFDHKIEISLPNLQERKEIFKIHLKNKSHSIGDKDLEHAANVTDGLAGAEIENLVNLAALQSVRKASSMKLQQSNLEAQDFLEYINGFMQDKNKGNVGMTNRHPHHYFRQ